MTVMSKIGKATGLAVGLGGAAQVRTPCGPRRIENIRIGDLVVTRDNGLQPVRAVWSRTVTEAEMAADPSLSPVRLRPRCIGPMMPKCDLLVAGDHRLLIPGWRLADQPDTNAAFISARDIAGTSDAAYVDRSRSEVTFHNLVFDAHQVFAANGMPVESFLLTDENLGQLDASTRQGIERSFPEARCHGAGCMPLRYPTTTRDHYLPEHA